MIHKINKTKEIKDRLLKEGKVTILNKPNHISIIIEMNKRLENFRREFKIKQFNSEITSKNIIVI